MFIDTNIKVKNLSDKEKHSIVKRLFALGI